MIVPICHAAAYVLLGVAAATDVAARTVPNALCLALALDGILLGVMRHTLAGSLLAALAVFVALAFVWRHGHLGGGDVKLISSATLLFHATDIATLILAISVAGGILGVAYLVMMRRPAAPDRGVPTDRLRRILRVERFRIRRGYSLPYAVAIAAGAVFTVGHEVVVQ